MLWKESIEQSDRTDSESRNQIIQVLDRHLTDRNSLALSSGLTLELSFEVAQLSDAINIAAVIESGYNSKDVLNMRQRKVKEEELPKVTADLKKDEIIYIIARASRKINATYPENTSPSLFNPARDTGGIVGVLKVDFLGTDREKLDNENPEQFHALLNSARFANFTVLPQFRGNSLSKCLMAKALTIILSKDKDFVRLVHWNTHDHSRLAEFYENLGFKLTGKDYNFQIGSVGDRYPVKERLAKITMDFVLRLVNSSRQELTEEPKKHLNN